MTGIQLSASWMVAQAAEDLAASSDMSHRRAGRSLRCCEVLSIRRVSGNNRKRGTQGIQIELGFYTEPDLDAVETHASEVEKVIAQAIGIWGGAVQISSNLIANEDQWIGVTEPYTRGGTGKRLNRYLTQDILTELNRKPGSRAWEQLGERHAQVQILLRRLRYRLGTDHGSGRAENDYAYWTTPTTEKWAAEERHDLKYLVHRLSLHSPDLLSGNADSANSLAPGYWGEVDTESDQLRVREVTTRHGTTHKDVRAVLDRAGAQIHHCPRITVKTNSTDPVRPFIDRLRGLTTDRNQLAGTDVLLVHRGGGVNPTPPDPRWAPSNVSNASRREMLDLCLQIRDYGVEVVVGLGHANVSILDWAERTERTLPLGIFEATTPTAGACWILQEHINPRLVDISSIYGQELST